MMNKKYVFVDNLCEPYWAGYNELRWKKNTIEG